MRRVTYTHLKDQETRWGVYSQYPISAGELVRVIKRNGEEHIRTVGEILWTDNRRKWIATLQES